MPGELSNVLAGRVANLFDFRGPNFTTDAACASGLAAMSAAVHGLVAGEYDAVITGGIDRNMGVHGFVKFCKIGALSATGTRPFDAGADGFVMGEGAALFVLKRLADAERDGDRVYAVLLGLGGLERRQGQGDHRPQPGRASGWPSSARGRTRGSSPAPPPPSRRTAPPPASVTPPSSAALGEVLRQLRRRAGLDRARLGQVQHRPPQGRRRRGRAVQDGHAAAREGARAEPALRRPQPQRRLGRTPRSGSTPSCGDWPADPDGARRGGVSAFGFGGTNFHAVLEEYVPGRYRDESTARTFAAAEVPRQRCARPSGVPDRDADRAAVGRGKAPLRGALVLGGARRRRRGRPARAGGGRRRHRLGAARRGARPRARPGARPRRHRLRRRRRPRGEGGQGASRRSAPASRRCGRCCAPRASSSGAARRPRWRSSTPGRARSTSTCCTDLRVAGADRRRDVRRGRPDHDPAARAPALVLHLHRRRTTRRPCSSWSSS